VLKSRVRVQLDGPEHSDAEHAGPEHSGAQHGHTKVLLIAMIYAISRIEMLCGKSGMD
jgi:hypothetical protein